MAPGLLKHKDLRQLILNILTQLEQSLEQKVKHNFAKELKYIIILFLIISFRDHTGR